MFLPFRVVVGPCPDVCLVGNAKRSVPLNDEEPGSVRLGWEVCLSEWSGPYPGLDFSPGPPGCLRPLPVES